LSIARRLFDGGLRIDKWPTEPPWKIHAGKNLDEQVPIVARSLKQVIAPPDRCDASGALDILDFSAARAVARQPLLCYQFPIDLNCSLGVGLRLG
jgi:hypothetical protein